MNPANIDLSPKNIFVLKKQLALSIFVIYALAMVSLYNLLVGVLARIRQVGEIPPTLVTAVLLTISSYIFLRMMKKMKYPLSEFGLNLKNPKQQIKDALVWSFFFCLLLFLVKWYLINYVELFSQLPLFSQPGSYGPVGTVLIASVYAVFAFLQSFCIQGAIQSSLLNLLSVKKSILISALVSTLLFSSFHIDMDFIFASVVSVPGLMWALMYAKHRSLLGVTISHALVGLWAFWGLNLYNLAEILFRHLKMVT